MSAKFLYANLKYIDVQSVSSDYVNVSSHILASNVLKMRFTGLGASRPPAFDKRRQQGYRSLNTTAHSGEVTSIALTSAAPINLHAFLLWLRELLADFDAEFYRYKGLLSIVEEDVRYVVQGVHSMVYGRWCEETPWREGEKRESRFVFIGRNLPKAEITAGWSRCRANRGVMNMPTAALCRMLGQDTADAEILLDALHDLLRRFSHRCPTRDSALADFRERGGAQLSHKRASLGLRPMPTRLDDLDVHCENGTMARRARQVTGALQRLAQVAELSEEMASAKVVAQALNPFDGCACCGIVC